MPVRKAPVRGDIGLATCKRLIALDSGIKQARTSKEAGRQARKAVEYVIHDIAEEAARLLKFKGTKTVTMKLLETCFDKNPFGITKFDIESASRPKGERGISVAGVGRIFRSKLDSDARLTGPANKALVVVAELYLRNLGKTAGSYAIGAKRRTIKPEDILAARKVQPLSSATA